MTVAIFLMLFFLLLLVLRIPVAVSMALSSILGFYCIGFNLNGIGSMVFTSINSSSLMSIPGFILAGAIMSNGGISKHLLNALRSWIGHISGGMAIVSVVACGFFAAITGSASATIAAVGGMMIPEMVASKYDKGFAMGLIASAGSLGILIPPSIPMILYAIIAEVSVAKLFAAGMIPGIFIMFIFSMYVILFSIKNRQGKFLKNSWKERLKLTYKAFWGIMLPVSILGGIYSGVMTPTESSAFASVYALVISIFIYKDYSFEKFVQAIYSSAKSTATILIIVTSCSMFSLYLTTARIPHQILELVAASDLSAIQILMICNLFIFVLGCFMDGVSIMLIAAPLMAPVIKNLGIDLIHFGIILTVGIQLGQVTPPVGINLFVVAAMEKEPFTKVLKGSIPFTFLLFISLILVTVFPGLSLWGTQLLQ